MQQQLDLSMSRSSLRKVLLQNGFRFRKVDKRRLLAERREIVVARASYLRSVRRLRQEQPGRQFVYLDETWFHQNDVQERAWLDAQEVTGRKTALGKGRRLVILHAGCSSGFIGGALFSLRNDGQAADYHSNMSADKFEKWFAEQLLPNIAANSVIIMDNASYHSRQKER